MIPGSRRFPRWTLGVIVVTLLSLPGPAQAREATWTRIWGSPDADFANGLALDSSYNSVVVGYTEDTGEPSATLDDAWVRSFDAQGTLRWSHEIVTEGYDGANDVAVDPAGNSYVVGNVNGALPGQTTTGVADAFLRKYDAAGTELWTRQFGIAGAQMQGDSVVLDDAGGVYFGGHVGAGDPNASFLPIILRKYDPDGNELWTRQFGRWPPGGTLSGMTFTAGTLYVAGSGAPEGDPGRFPTIGFLKAFTPDGTELWSHEDGTDLYEVNGFASNASGRIAEAGWVHHPDNTAHPYVRVLDSSGSEIWQTRADDDFTDQLYNGLAVDDAGNVFLGRTKLDLSSDGGSAQLTRLNADGTLAWRFVIDPTPPNSVVNDIVAPPNGALYLVGSTDGDFAGATQTGGWIDAYLLELNQVASCAGTSHPEGNEEGTLSAQIHQSVEPKLPAPVDGVAHNLNCKRIEPHGL